MSLLRVLILTLVCLPAAHGQSAAADHSGLITDTGWELVYAHCSACHSLRLVTAQRGDRSTWLQLIRWMQATQNLWQFEPAIEARILDYLEANYPPGLTARRAPLPADLRP